MCKFEIEGLISKVNWHNRVCNELFAVVYDKDVDEARFEKNRRENLEFGIEMCCEMRAAGFDAHVDRVTGAVVDGKRVDLTEEIEGEGLRYLTFEWANSHKEEA